MSRETVCPLHILTHVDADMFSSVSNKASASVWRVQSCPHRWAQEMNEPIGRRGSLSRHGHDHCIGYQISPPRPGPRRADAESRRDAGVIAFPSTRRVTGIPVQRETISAISSSVTSSRRSRFPLACHSTAPHQLSDDAPALAEAGRDGSSRRRFRS